MEANTKPDLHSFNVLVDSSNEHNLKKVLKMSLVYFTTLMTYDPNGQTPWSYLEDIS